MQIESLYRIFLEYPHIIIDTRKVIKDSLFFAVGRKDERGVHRGCQFAEAALEAGAAIVVVNDPLLLEKHSGDSRWVLVDDCETALQQLGRYHREKLEIPVIAIAGSNGKTTTKELIQAVLSTQYCCFSTPGNLNNHLGVPLSLLQIGKHHEIAVMEVGANHLDETAFLCRLVQPTYGLVTNCGKDHLGEYGSFENVIKANKELYDYFEENGGLVFVNGRDEILCESSKAVEQRILYGDDNNSVRAEITSSPLLELDLWINDESTKVKTALFGDFWRDAVLAAAQIGHQFGIEIHQIAEAISAYRPAALRSQMLEWMGNILLLDCYNANPSSMEVFIRAAQQSPEMPKLLVLGEMLELGDYSDEEHQFLLDKQIDYTRFEKVILIGNEFTKVKIPDLANVSHFVHRKDAQLLLKNNFSGGENFYIYVKGSRGNRLEELFQ
jgi:UDP-N-acetylmuramoyl-tripeptide--D-alanyl-D-alanine ligase